MAKVLSRKTKAPSQKSKATSQKTKGLAQKELDLIDAYWRAANYLSVGQIYLYDNPLLKDRKSVV